jgi:hypothetical protein
VKVNPSITQLFDAYRGHCGIMDGNQTATLVLAHINAEVAMEVKRLVNLMERELVRTNVPSQTPVTPARNF